jgi:predicted Zn-dependent protease
MRPPRPDRRAAVALLLLATACVDASAPLREDTYAFALPLNGLVFRWTAERLPVRYWVASNAGVVREFAGQALDTWGRQFLYGEFRGVLVTDSATADVLIAVAPQTPPDVPATDDPPVAACSGVTSFDLTDDDRLVGPFQVRITWDLRYDDADVVNCLQRVTTHEIGHTLGIFGHSPAALDLMNAYPAVAAPSTADRATAEVLYHTTPTIRPPLIP